MLNYKCPRKISICGVLEGDMKILYLRRTCNSLILDCVTALLVLSVTTTPSCFGGSLEIAFSAILIELAAFGLASLSLFSYCNFDYNMIKLIIWSQK